MANAIKWSALGGATTGITGTNLRSIADGANKLGAEYDNSSGHNMYADFVAKLTFNTQPVVGDNVSLYILGAPDGSNYEYGADAVDPPATAWRGSFVVRLTTATHYCVLKHILLPNTKFKPLIMNDGGSRLSGTAADNALTFHMYNPEVQ